MSCVLLGPLNVPNYTALTTDVVANAIVGANVPGRTVLITDSGAWKIIKEDLTLEDYALPMTFAGSISVGAVSVGDSAAGVDGLGNFGGVITTTGGAVSSAPLYTLPMLFNGATWDRPRARSKFVSLSAVDITTIATVWTPAGGKKFRLMGGSISVSSACNILFEDNAGGSTIVRTPKLLVDTPYNFDLGNGILSGAANRVLKATASTGTVAITGHLYGTEE
jgi:hypothetical protein